MFCSLWWGRGITPDHHIIYKQPHTAKNFINQKSKLACNLKGTDELPGDGTWLPKVAAAK
jgi:hypothetical protein